VERLARNGSGLLRPRIWPIYQAEDMAIMMAAWLACVFAWFASNFAWLACVAAWLACVLFWLATTVDKRACVFALLSIGALLPILTCLHCPSRLLILGQRNARRNACVAAPNPSARAFLLQRKSPLWGLTLSYLVALHTSAMFHIFSH